MSGHENKPADAVTVKREGFIDKVIRAETVSFTVCAVLALSVFLNIVLGVLLVQMYRSPRPIHYITGTAGVSFPNKIDKGAVIGFAQSWVQGYLNFNAMSIDSVFESAMKYMSPGLLAKTRARIQSETDKVKRNALASIYNIDGDAEFEETALGYVVSFKGIQAIYQGKINTRVQHIHTSVFLKKVPPTETNPFGLLVDSVDQKELMQK